jgi:hypothetical protein
MSLWNAVAWGQQTSAARAMASKRSGAKGGRRSAKRRKTKVARVKSRPRKSSKGRARLVKGSAAAKAYMAKIRRKRK